VIHVEAVRDPIPQLTDLIQAWPFRPFRFHRDVADNDVRQLVLARVTRVLARSTARAWVAHQDDGPLCGLAILEPREWDTRVLQMSAGKLDLLADRSAGPAIVGSLVEAAIAGARQAGIRHLSARVDAADDVAVHALESRGFLNVDALLTFSAPTSAVTRSHSDEVAVRPATPANAIAVGRLAAAAFKLGRFHSDPSLPAGRADEVYQEWAVACCQGTAADHVALAEVDGVLQGFVACGIDRDTAVHLRRAAGTIPLIASSTTRRGIGATLISAAADWFSAQGVESIDVGTQLRNVPAARLYERCGFRAAAGALSFRMMIDP
jgi:ribosomal-protein-alanine N-acetyltransferase